MSRPMPNPDDTATAQLSLQDELQALFEQQLGLPPVPGTYLRPLPRVVLLCLEAWDRRDFASYLTSKLTATAVG